METNNRIIVVQLDNVFSVLFVLYISMQILSVGLTISFVGSFVISLVQMINVKFVPICYVSPR
jgi:hypothetical protein